MHGARDQFLAGAGFAVDQHGGIGGRHGLHLLQHAAQRLALADDLFELQLAADFVFEIQLLLRELVLQVGDFAERQRVFDGDRHLARDLRRETPDRPAKTRSRASCPG